MAFTFAEALTADRDWIRLKIGNTVENFGPRPVSGNRDFSDALIAAVLADEGHKVATVAALFEILAAEWGRYKTTEREGEVSVEAKEVSAYYAALADEWRSKTNGGGGGRNTISAGVVGLDIASKGDDWPDDF